MANDGTACWLFENQGGLRFEEVGEARGVAFDGQGNALAGMGSRGATLMAMAALTSSSSNFYDRSTIAFQALGQGAYRDVFSESGADGRDPQRARFRAAGRGLRR